MVGTAYAEDTIAVGPSGCDYTSIQTAINAANPGDTIEVHSGTYYENVNVNKPVILKGENKSAEMPVVDAGNMGSVITLSADGVTVVGLNVTNSGNNLPGEVQGGIRVISDNNTIVGNDVSYNKNGIVLRYSNNSIIKYNTVCNNKGHGILLYSCNRNVILGNNASNNNHDGRYYGNGICIDTRSNNNTIEGNNAHQNGDDGILISSSRDNNVVENNVSGNGAGGIHLNCVGLGNTVKRNNAVDNRFGIYLTTAYFNRIYLNNFINNTNNVYSWDSTNFWSSQEQMAYQYKDEIFTNHTGNYWSDYRGYDSDEDRIGEIPYTIDPKPMPGPDIPNLPMYREALAQFPTFYDKDDYPLMCRFEDYSLPS